MSCSGGHAPSWCHRGLQQIYGAPRNTLHSTVHSAQCSKFLSDLTPVSLHQRDADGLVKIVSFTNFPVNRQVRDMVVGAKKVQECLQIDFPLVPSVDTNTPPRLGI